MYIMYCNVYIFYEPSKTIHTRPGHELIQARGKIEGGERQGLRLTSDHCQGHAGRGKKERGSRASSWDELAPPKLRRPTSSRRPRLKNESVYIGPRLISPPSRHSCNQWVGHHSPFSFPPLIRPYRVHALLPSLIFAIVNRLSSSPLFHCVTLASNLDISFSSFIYRGRIMEELLVARLYNAPSGIFQIF